MPNQLVLYVGRRVFVVNQGIVRVATITVLTQRRVTIVWKNSVRSMFRLVSYVTDINEWLTRPNSRCIPLDAFTEANAVNITNTNIRTAKADLKTQGFAPIAKSPEGVVTAANLVDFIIAYESGQLNTTGTLELFSYLIKSGMAWKLRGSYGRAAAALIENGTIGKDGTIHEAVA